MTCSVCGRSVSFDHRVGYLHTVPPALVGGVWHEAVPSVDAVRLVHPASGERAA